MTSALARLAKSLACDISQSLKSIGNQCRLVDLSNSSQAVLTHVTEDATRVVANYLQVKLRRIHFLVYEFLYKRYQLPQT